MPPPLARILLAPHQSNDRLPDRLLEPRSDLDLIAGRHTGPDGGFGRREPSRAGDGHGARGTAPGGTLGPTRRLPVIPRRQSLQRRVLASTCAEL